MAQVKYGDYARDDEHKPGAFIHSDRLMPQRVFSQYKYGKEDWEKKIVDWWAGHRGQSRETAMLEYLKLAQDLEMYGVNVRYTFF